METYITKQMLDEVAGGLANGASLAVYNSAKRQALFFRKKGSYYALVLMRNYRNRTPIYVRPGDAIFTFDEGVLAAGDKFGVFKIGSSK